MILSDITPITNFIGALLLARFAINDVPHAIGLVGNPRTLSNSEDLVLSNKTSQVLKLKRKFPPHGFTFTLIEEGLTYNQAFNRAEAHRREDSRRKRAFGRTGFKRNLYRIGQVSGQWGIFELKRGY